MKKEAVKKIVDDFEDDNFVDAKETLKGELKDKVNSYLKDKLDLQNDSEPSDNIDDSDDDDLDND